MANAWRTNEMMDNVDSRMDLRNVFTCNTANTSPKATNVHALKPNDIDIIGAIGDSLTVKIDLHLLSSQTL
jgi:hypothetical protein